jgi:type IV secretory pathway VirJ component
LPVAFACLTSACRSGAQHAPDTDPALRDLPLAEVPARGVSTGTLAIFISGDGGWADLDRGVADGLAAHGVGVVGLDARAYLARRRTPEQSAADVARVARSYTARWGAPRLVLVGYSRGATMLPFVATRLPADVRGRVVLLAMLGLEGTANFEFHWVDIVGTVRRADDRPVRPELERLRGARMLCIYGVKEADGTCRDADPTLVTRVSRPGDHHFDRDWGALAGIIVGAM